MISNYSFITTNPLFDTIRYNYIFLNRYNRLFSSLINLRSLTLILHLSYVVMSCTSICSYLINHLQSACLFFTSSFSWFSFWYNTLRIKISLYKKTLRSLMPLIIVFIWYLHPPISIIDLDGLLTLILGD